MKETKYPIVLKGGVNKYTSSRIVEGTILTPTEKRSM